MPRARSFNHFGAVIRAMPDGAGDVVEKVTQDIAAGAAANAPIDTGALAASYKAEMVGPTEGVAGSNMEYSPYVEYGTLNNGPQPHLVPAADRVLDTLAAAGMAFGDRIERAARNG